MRYATLVLSILSLQMLSPLGVIVLFWGQPAHAQNLTWQQREQWIVGEQQEIEQLQGEIANALLLPAAVIALMPEFELAWLAHCADAAHTGFEAATINQKIDRLQQLQADLPRQWNLLPQQLKKNPAEWHRFQLQQKPYNERQARLKQQGRTMSKPAKGTCPARKPSQRKSAGVPANCSAIFAQENQLSQQMIWQPTWEAQQAVKRQLDAIEPDAMACRKAVLGPNAPPENLYSEFPKSRPPPSGGLACGQGVRC
jgi:hypothetical protein